LVKPFAYCLPGHRHTPRRVVFLVGIVTNFLLSWLALDCHGLSVLEAPGRMVALLSVGLISYLSCVLMTQAWPMKERLVTFCGFLVPLAIYARWPDTVNALLVRAPGVFIVAGLIFSAMVWRYLQGDTRARVLCGQPVFGLADSSRSYKLKFKRLQQTQYARQRGDTLPSPVESLFLEQMKSAPATRAARHAWGSMYLAFGPALEKWKLVLFLILSVTVLLAYRARSEDMDIPVSEELWGTGALLCWLLTQLPLPIRSDILLTAGRRERFIGVLALTETATMLISIVLLLAAMLAAALHGIAPAYFGCFLDVRALLLPLALAPATIVLSVLVPGMVLQYIIFFGLAGFLMILEMEIHFVTVPFVLAASVCTWAVFTLLMHRICTKRCLVA
jgi:hypothetical protein